MITQIFMIWFDLICWYIRDVTEMLLYFSKWRQKSEFITETASSLFGVFFNPSALIKQYQKFQRIKNLLFS